MDLLDATNFALDRIFDSSKRAAATREPSSFAPAEGSSPAADTGTAGVGDLYPVTCEERYYDAASRILEDEGRLAGNPHDNANELGALIEAWIHRARNNWVPR